MRLALMPHTTPYFGQDFTTTSLANHLQLTPIYLKGGKYNINTLDLNKVSLAISRYPDRQSDLDLFQQMHCRIPLVAHVHLNYDFLTMQQKSILCQTLPLASVLLTTSKKLKEQYQNLFPQYNWQFVNNGIDPKVYFPASDPERSEFRKRYRIKKDQLVLCFVGRLHNAKGLQLIRALSKRICTDERYVLAIQTIEHPKYISPIQDLGQFKNVIVIREQHERIVRYVDISIHPSLSETTSLVVLESLFAGVPVVCSDVTNFYDEIEKGFAPFPYFDRFPIKDFIKPAENGKLEFALTEESVDILVNILMTRIGNISAFSRFEKETLAIAMGNSPFTFSKMATALERIYSNAVMSFQEGTKARSLQAFI